MSRINGGPRWKRIERGHLPTESLHSARFDGSKLPMEDLSLPIPDELIDALARRVAQIVLAEVEDDLRPAQGRWLRAKDAAEYLGWTRSALYSRVQSQSIPHYKIESMLLFKRDELDRWLEEHRIEPRRG